MEKVIFISPHLDDSILSCAGLIQKLIKQSTPVEILTVFSESNLSHQDFYLMRQHEDKKAANILGASVEHLQFLDAPFRSDNPNLFFQNLVCEKQTMELLTEKLNFIFSNNSNAIFYAPLGVGWHKDHLITFVSALSAIPKNRLRFYEEAPYSLIKHQTELRLYGVNHYLIEDFVANFFKAKYVNKFLSHWTKEFLIKAITTYDQLKIPIDIKLFEEIIFKGNELKMIDEAKKQYVSQVDFYEPINENYLKERYFIS